MRRSAPWLIFASVFFQALNIACSENNGLEVDLDGLHAVSQLSGIHTGSTNSRSAGILSFTVSIPAGASSEPRPLILALHQGGSRASNLSLGYVQTLAEPGFHDIRPNILAPELPLTASAWTDPIAETVVLDFIEAAQQVWSIDPNRIVLTGYSAGGIGAWFIAGKHPGRFSAAIPMASEVVIGKLRGAYDIPFYVIHGSNDELFDIDDVRLEIDDAIVEGANITLVEVEGASHSQRSAYKSALADAAAWLESEVW